MKPVFGRVWLEAAETFGKRRGHKESLTPFGDTWNTVLDRAEHAIRVWDEKYGPLNAGQWAYAGDLLCHALVAARSADTPGEMYAYFHTRLTHLLNHERTAEGFRRRMASEREAGAILDSILEEAA